jgi:hypothetical protein
MGETANAANEEKNEIRVISELIENAGLFESRGYSIVKITTVGPDKTSVEASLKIPIKSTGVAEYQEKLTGNAPRPPVVRETIKKDSKEGKDRGLIADQEVRFFDETDEDYIDALNKHNQEFLWQVVVFALDAKLKMTSGEYAQTYEEKKRVLQSNHITRHHVNRIFKDVQNLTQFTEDRDDFL